MDAKPIKEKVKAKAKAVKEKLKGTAKASKLAKALGVSALAALCLAGCQTPNQASRGTSNENGDFEPSVAVTVNGSSNTVSVVIRGTYGDGAIASADSSGSTETQTQTPTFDLRTRVDARYNDAVAGASDASKRVLGGIGDGLTAILDLMQSKKSGTVAVTKTDGTPATVKCEGGQCSFCTDCDDK